MEMLMEHFDKIDEGMQLIDKSMSILLYASHQEQDSSAVNMDFPEIIHELTEVEDKADKIKRNIRNHLPRGLGLSVDRTLIFTYTREQDEILDSAQDCLYWLNMRPLNIPDQLHHGVTQYTEDVSNSIHLLKPALAETIALLNGKTVDREEAKEKYRIIRDNHKKVNRQKNQLLPQIFNMDSDFRQIYQLMHFVEALHDMSHSAERCTDTLRAMLAR